MTILKLYLYLSFGALRELFFEFFEKSGIDANFAFNYLVIVFIYYLCVELIHDVSHDRHEVKVVAEFQCFRYFLLNDFALFDCLFCTVAVRLNQSSHTEHGSSKISGNYYQNIL